MNDLKADLLNMYSPEMNSLHLPEAVRERYYRTTAELPDEVFRLAKAAASADTLPARMNALSRVLRAINLTNRQLRGTGSAPTPEPYTTAAAVAVFIKAAAVSDEGIVN